MDSLTTDGATLLAAAIIRQAAVDARIGSVECRREARKWLFTSGRDLLDVLPVQIGGEIELKQYVLNLESETPTFFLVDLICEDLQQVYQGVIQSIKKEISKWIHTS